MGVGGGGGVGMGGETWKAENRIAESLAVCEAWKATFWHPSD